MEEGATHPTPSPNMERSWPPQRAAQREGYRDERARGSGFCATAADGLFR